MLDVEFHWHFGYAGDVELSVCRCTCSIISESVRSFRFYYSFFADCFGFASVFSLGFDLPFFPCKSYGISSYCCCCYCSVACDTRFSPNCARKHLTASVSYWPVWKNLTAEEGSLFANFFPLIALIKGRWTNLGTSAPNKR